MRPSLLRVVQSGAAALAATLAVALVTADGVAQAPPVPSEAAPTAVPAPTTWTKCVNEGTECRFVGLRRVRFGAGTRWVEKTFYGGVWDRSAWNAGLGWCNSNQFDGVDPAPDVPKRCDIAPIQYSRIANPHSAHNGLAPTVVVAKGHPGYGESLIGPSDDFGAIPDDGTGSFRIVCPYSHMAFDDPIVYPGKPGASHLHVFFGNTATSAASTATSIATTGRSTCTGGIANRTAYWAPAVFHTGTKQPLVPEFATFYYKTGYAGVAPRDIVPMPKGLRMIAGDMKATGPQPAVRWSCLNGATPGDRGSIPNCAKGDSVVLSIAFPQCWDGRNLDSADHKSHMAYPPNGCPASHPVAIPEISMHIHYRVFAAGAPLKWRLSSDMYSTSRPGGYSAHADWFDGWDEAVKNTWVRNCDNVPKDCHGDLLGDGRTLEGLFPVEGPS